MSSRALYWSAAKNARPNRDARGRKFNRKSDEAFEVLAFECGNCSHEQPWEDIYLSPRCWRGGMGLGVPICGFCSQPFWPDWKWAGAKAHHRIFGDLKVFMELLNDQ